MTESANPPEPTSRKKKVLFTIFSCGVLFFVVLVLAAIATPKFGGFGQNCRSRQSEAKTNLSGLFSAEKAFLGEYNTYSTDLVSVNWFPDGNPAYVYGFAAPSETTAITGVPAHDPTRRTTDDPRVVGEPARYGTAKMKRPGGGALLAADLESAAKDATTRTTSFLAAAVGDTDGDETLDVWTIDESKSLVSVVNDCAD